MSSEKSKTAITFNPALAVRWPHAVNKVKKFLGQTLPRFLLIKHMEVLAKLPSKKNCTKRSRAGSTRYFLHKKPLLYC